MQIPQILGLAQIRIMPFMYGYQLCLLHGELKAIFAPHKVDTERSTMSIVGQSRDKPPKNFRALGELQENQELGKTEIKSRMNFN